ncbi:MAG: SAM-dependent methyltransferase [Candidatus Protistobacter heckmanni]|nr:SAM-dependent methyltransferase [Candidatus Protistobacter heckmanni]
MSQPGSPDTAGKEKTGALYLVPHPLGDADPAAVAAVLSAPAITRIAALTDYVAENAKTARALIKAVGALSPLSQPLQQMRIAELNRHTPADRLPELLAPLREGRDLGLVSEAGMPAIADPGADLVRLAHAEGIRVVPLTGPSSLLLALAASGLNGQKFAFHGYLPVEPDARAAAIKQLEAESRRAGQTQLLIETPYRNVQMLQALIAACAPGTLVCAATDLTLESESIISMPAADWKRLPQERIAALNKRPTVFLLLAH